MRGRRKGSCYGFLMFSSLVRCTLAVVSVWQELPGDTVGSRDGCGHTAESRGMAQSRWTGCWLTEP